MQAALLCSPLQTQPWAVYLALTPSDNSSSVRSEGQVDLKSFGSREGQTGIYFPSLRHHTGAYTKPSWKPDLAPHGSGPSTWETEAEVAHELEASPGYVPRLSIRKKGDGSDASETRLCLGLNDGSPAGHWNKLYPETGIEQRKRGGTSRS